MYVVMRGKRTIFFRIPFFCSYYWGQAIASLSEMDFVLALDGTYSRKGGSLGDVPQN
jgi:hypothetical protein